MIQIHEMPQAIRDFRDLYYRRSSDFLNDRELIEAFHKVHEHIVHDQLEEAMAVVMEWRLVHG